MYLTTIARESSGRNMLDGLLRRHPELAVYGYSYPSEYHPLRNYPPIVVTDALCILCRDTTVSQASVERRGYNKGCEGRFTREDSIRAIEGVMQDFQRAGKPVVWASYETLIAYRETYLRSLFVQLGVNQHRYDYRKALADLRDENAKYFSS